MLGWVMGVSMRQGITVQVSEGDRERLAAIVADRNSPQKHVWRARIVLMTADGVGTTTIMRQTGKSKVTVWRWQERFMAQGVDGLLCDKTRPSRIPRLPATVHEQTVALTQTDPPGEVTHWTAPMMAKQVGISVSSVQRIWHTHGLQPHRVRLFKLSRDRQFVTKLRDIVGLYVDPPAHAVVLSVDEKSQIQALDRTQPGLPMKKGRYATMTHDYKRHGTTTCLPRSTSWKARSSVAACSAIAIRSSFAFSIRSKPTSPPARSSTSSSTTTQHTSTPRFGPGSTGTPALSSTTPRPRPPGSMRSRASSPN